MDNGTGCGATQKKKYETKDNVTLDRISNKKNDTTKMRKREPE